MLLWCVFPINVLLAFMKNSLPTECLAGRSKKQIMKIIMLCVLQSQMEKHLLTIWHLIKHAAATSAKSLTQCKQHYQVRC